MASNLKLANATATAECEAIASLLDSGYLRIYDGTQAANADTAVGAQVLLAELRFNAAAFGAPSNGVATAGAFTADASANASGNATWFRALSSDGSSTIFDGNVSTSGADLNLNSVAIVAGVNVQVTSMTLTAPKNA